MRKQLIPLMGIIMISAIVFGVVYGAATHFIKNEFVNIENKDVSTYVTTAVDALQEKIQQLGVKSTDWASWNDSYAFVVDRNQDYIDSNLTDTSLQILGLSYIIYLNNSNNLVYLKSIVKDLDTPANTKELLRHFSSQGALLSTAAAPSHWGIISLPAGSLLFYSRPILDSNGEGPARGTLVFAHYLVASDIAQISKQTRLNIDYLPVNSASLPKDVLPIYKTMSDNTPTIVEKSKQQVQGYQLIDDTYGKHVLLAQVTQPRVMYLEAQKALRYFMLIVLAMLLFGVSICAYILSRLAAKDEIIHVKDDFFSIASHEIRTPLTAIKGNAQLLTQIYGEKNGAEFIEITNDIKTSGERLIRLVTNYLDVARLEQDRTTFHNETFALRDVAQDVVDELQGIAQEKQIAIKNAIDERALTVYADKDHVKQIFYNLIGNALKFTEKGSITITALAADTMVRVHITDTGRGVSESGKAAMFNKFEQTQKGDAATGSGLGLYISKMLIEKMGGSIYLESTEIDKGTTISFTLPAGQ